MKQSSSDVIDVLKELTGVFGYANREVSHVNDHVIRVSVMTEDFYWHRHPDSDETFFVLEGAICIDMHGRTVELLPGQLFTVPKDFSHRTRPRGERSVNITFGRADMVTIREKFD